MEFPGIAPGIAAAAALPLFLLLYFLKRRHEVAPVPSTKLWRQALSALYADRPWQRLRTGLLFFLQLFAILLLVFSSFRPASGAGLPKETVVVLDVSGSMRAVDVAPSRFTRAREEALRLVSSMNEGGRMTLIAAGVKPEILVGRSSDRPALRRALYALQCGAGPAALEPALQLASALAKEAGAAVVVLSDRYTGGYAVYCGGEGANRAVETFTADRVEGELQALAVVKSYGYAGAVTAECYADGALADVREAEIAPGGTAVFNFTALPSGAVELNVRLLGEDALALDDGAHCVVTAPVTHRVLLVSERNVFLEAALQLREDVEIYRQADALEAALAGYDLYVFDGALPEALPEDGNCLFINPPGPVAGLTPAPAGGGALSAAQGGQAEALLANVNVSEILVSQSSAFTLGGGWQPLARLGGGIAAAYAETGGRRLAALGFDLHNSNLPMRKEFPILMRNLLDWTVIDASSGVTEADAGGEVPLTAHARSARVEVVTPSGRAVPAAPPYPPSPFAFTGELGVYAVRQYDGEGNEIPEALRRFAVNAATSTESDLQATDALPLLAGAGAGGERAASVHWWLFAATAALALILAEWLVTRRVR